MVSKLKVLAAVGIGLAVVTRSGRARLASVPGAVRQASRRRRLALPKGVEQYTPTLVDRRQASASAPGAASVQAESPAEIAAEYYQEQPAG